MRRIFCSYEWPTLLFPLPGNSFIFECQQDDWTDQSDAIFLVFLPERLSFPHFFFFLFSFKIEMVEVEMIQIKWLLQNLKTAFLIRYILVTAAMFTT